MLFFFSTYLYFERETATQQSQHLEETKSGTPFNIAIFEPAPHPAIDEITTGFKKTLEKNGTKKYAFTVYNANGNKTLLRAQAEEIVHHHYDLIFTIGAGCTQLIKELTTKKHIMTPVVFSAVEDPVTMGIINSLTSSGNNLTGIIERANYREQIAVLTTLKPTTRSILLVYDPSHGTGLEKDRNELERIAATYGISLPSVAIYSTGELQQKVEGLLHNVDVVLVLRDNTIVSALDALVKLCNRYGVTLYVSDLNSGEKGAALAYGFVEQDFGIQSAHKALAILEQQMTPSAIAITSLGGYKALINTSTMQQQNLLINPTLLFLLRATQFTGNSNKDVA